MLFQVCCDEHDVGLFLTGKRSRKIHINFIDIPKNKRLCGFPSFRSNPLAFCKMEHRNINASVCVCVFSRISTMFLSERPRNSLAVRRYRVGTI